MVQTMAHTFYLLCSTGAVSAGLITVLTAVLSSILGPGLALRGKYGTQSMHIAVDVLTRKSVGCYNCFLMQLSFFYISCSLLMFSKYSLVVAIFVNVIMMAFMIKFLIQGHYLVQRLRLNEDEAVSGRFENFGNNAQNLVDLNQRPQSVFDVGSTQFQSQTYYNQDTHHSNQGRSQVNSHKIMFTSDSKSNDRAMRDDAPNNYHSSHQVHQLNPN